MKLVRRLKLIIITTIATVSLSACTSLQAPATSEVPITDKEIKTDIGRGTTEENVTKPANSGYVEYSPENFDAAAGGRRVLFFYASWCPTCKAADTNFKEEATQIPPDVSLIRTNYQDSNTDSQEKDLAEKYGITYQHTFVQIDSDGNEVAKWNGGKIEELLSNLK